MENFDLTQLTNEELSDLQNLIYFEKQNRAKEKEKKLVDAFRMAWDDLEKEGIDLAEIYYPLRHVVMNTQPKMIFALNLTKFTLIKSLYRLFFYFTPVKKLTTTPGTLAPEGMPFFHPLVNRQFSQIKLNFYYKIIKS